MDFILSSLFMLGMVIVTARQAQIPPELILALIEVESNGQPYAVRIHPVYPYTVPQARRPPACSMDTELYMQRTSWGLMQIMGATARSAGFEGWLPELVEPHVNLEIGVAHIGNLMSRYRNKHGVDGVIAAWNAGSPRKNPDGKFINQAYVDKVLKAMEKYKTVVEEKEEDAVAEVEKATVEGDEDGNPPESDGAEKPGGEATESEPQKTGLDDMTKPQLLAYAKEKGIEVPAKGTNEVIRAAIRTAEEAAGKTE